MAPILVLHEDQDLSAIWLADRLVSRGHAVERFSGAAFANATRWRHRLGSAGIEVCIDFADGRSIGGKAYVGLLNRLPYLPHPILAQLGGDDGDYARQEWFALFLSWLEALECPKLNRPTPQGLAGNWRHPADWTMLAHQVGLPVLDWSQTEADDPMLSWQKRPPGALPVVIAMPTALVDPLGLPADMAEACRALASLSGGALIGIHFEPDEQTCWRFSGASVMPDLFAGGEALVDAIAAEFSQ